MGSPITIHLRSGKTMQGELEAHTDFYVRFWSGTHHYLIPWAAIEWVRYEKD